MKTKKKTKVLTPKRKTNYVNNKDLTEAVVAYQKDCKKATKAGLPQPVMPKYIGECVIQICNRLTKGFNFDFSNYSYRDLMISDAIERCCYAVLKFNAKKSTHGAFSYMTTVAINAMKKRIIDEKKQNYIKHKVFQTHIVNSHGEASLEPNEHSYRVVEDFETKLEAKKAAAAAMK